MALGPIGPKTQNQMAKESDHGNVCLLCYTHNLKHNQFGIKIISAQVGVFYSLYMIDKTRLQNMEL